jgi:hypothetical protein
MGVEKPKVDSSLTSTWYTLSVLFFPYINPNSKSLFVHALKFAFASKGVNWKLSM